LATRSTTASSNSLRFLDMLIQRHRPHPRRPATPYRCRANPLGSINAIAALINPLHRQAASVTSRLLPRHHPSIAYYVAPLLLLRSPRCVAD
jgi:hypothetical protein